MEVPLRSASTFNFGPDIQNWFKIFYNNLSSCVLNNGHASVFFNLHRGVRQGCPLSGVLFVLGIELFSRTLKKDPTIRGIKVNKGDIKVTQYADDTTVFVRDLDSVNSLLRLLNEFHLCSGPEINTTKTEAMWLGKWKNRKDTPFGFKWPTGYINALGVCFSHNQAIADSLNFGEKIQNLEKTLNAWQRRSLTLYGKTNTVETLGLSKLVYSVSVLTVPVHYTQEINKLIFNFIWAGKPPKFKRTTIIGEKKNGGLKACDFNIMEKALKIAWVNRIQNDSNAPWKKIPNHLVHKHGSLSFLTKCNYATNTLDLKNLPIFYKIILDYWCEFKKSSGYGITSHLKNEVPWKNCNILVDNKPVFYQNWFDKAFFWICINLEENST